MLAMERPLWHALRSFSSNPGRRAIRPTKASKAAVRYVRNTSKPVTSSARRNIRQSPERQKFLQEPAGNQCSGRCTWFDKYAGRQPNMETCASRALGSSSRACEVIAGSCSPLADHRAQKTRRSAGDLGKPDPRPRGCVRGPTPPRALDRIQRPGSQSKRRVAGLSAATRGLIAARTAVMSAVAAIDADMRRMTRASAACRRTGHSAR